MCRVRSCCFCLSLRTGTYFAAIYTIVVLVLQLIGSILAIVNLGKGQKIIEDQTGKEIFTSKDETLAKILYWAAIVLLIVWLISAILVIVGVRKERRGWLIPWLVITIIMIVFAAFGIIAALIEHEETFKSGGRAFTFVLQVLIFLFNVYLVVVVCSFYKNNLKEADER